MANPLAIVQTGNAAPGIVRRHGDFEDMFIRLGRIDPMRAEIVFASRGEALRPPAAYSGAIIAGSPFMVTDKLPWSESLAAWLREAMDAALPLLAVCYGHQLLAHALGGTVDYHPYGMELGTKQVQMNAAASAYPLLAPFPPVFAANLSHSQTVALVPPGGKVLASSSHDPHQIIAYGDHALSVQFHPEFDGAIMRAFIEREALDGSITREAASRLEKDVTDTPEALDILRNFVKRIGAP